MELNEYFGVLLLVLVLLMIVGFYMLVSSVQRVRGEMRAGGVDIGNISMMYENLLRDHKLWEEWYELDREVLRIAVCQKESYLFSMVENTKKRYNNKREKILNKIGNM